MKKGLLFLLLISTTSLRAQWSIDSVSSAYNGFVSTQNGNKAIFASGSKFEIYNFSTSTWSQQNMSFARPNIKAATAGNVSYFAGGGFISVNSYAFYKYVDIYSANTNSWTTSNLSVARIVGASAAIGNKVLFAGGRLILNYSTKVDIFDVTTNTLTTASLSQARTNMATAVVGNKVIFAGGETGNISSGVYTVSNKVDIYDNTTGLWSNTTLSEKRQNISVAVVGNKVLFAGGITASGLYSNHIDIYDASTNTWSLQYMSETKYGISTAVAGNFAYLAGGSIDNTGLLSSKVEIFNSTNNTLSSVTISSPRMNMCVAKTNKRIMFAGGITTWGNVGTNRIEVLDLASNTWTVEYLSRPRLNLASANLGSEALFVGGAEVWSSYPQYSVISNRVDKWKDLGPAIRLKENNDHTISIYPSPFQSYFNLKSDNSLLPGVMTIYNQSGALILKETINENDHLIQLEECLPGLYILNFIGSDGVRQSYKILKQ